MPLLQCTATPPGGSGQCNSCNVRAHQLGGRRVLARRWLLPEECNSFNARPHRLGQWAVQLLLYTASLFGAVGSGTPAINCRTAQGAAGNATLAIPCLTTWGQWAVQLLQCTATPPGGGGQFPMARAHQLGGRAVTARWRSVPMEAMRGAAVPRACRGRQFPTARAHQLGGRGVLPRRRGGLRGTALPNGPGPSTGGTGSPALVAVGAYGGLAGDGSPLWPGPTSSGDSEPSPGGSRCSRRAYGGQQFPTAPAHRLRGREVLPRQRSVLMGALRGTALPNGLGPPTWGTGSPALVAVGAYGGPAGDGSPHRRGPTSLGDGKSCPGGGRCPWSACGGWQPPKARAHRLGERGVLPRRWSGGHSCSSPHS